MRHAIYICKKVYLKQTWRTQKQFEQEDWCHEKLNLEDSTKNSELDDFDDKVEAEVRLAGSHVVGTRTPLMMHDHDQTSTWS